MSGGTEKGGEPAAEAHPVVPVGASVRATSYTLGTLLVGRKQDASQAPARPALHTTAYVAP